MHDIEPTRGKVPGRLRRYWQGVVLAAAVSYGQLQVTGETRGAVMPPYVQMLPEQPPGFHPLEVVGRQVLTVPLDLSGVRRGDEMSGAMRETESAS
jgi:hypothetical protein